MQTKLLSVFFDSVAYQYYPIGLHESEEGYHKSRQYQNYLELHSGFENIRALLEPDLRELVKEFDGLPSIHNGSTTHYPVYEIELYLGTKEEAKTFLSVYISFMIPFFHIAHLTYEIESGKILHDQNPHLDIKEKVSRRLNEIMGYNEFPKELLMKPVPNLMVWDNFTYLNAFFTDFYRITHQH